MLGYSLTDSDSDGVRDGKDKCPGTPKGAIVDKNGCPWIAMAMGCPTDWIAARGPCTAPRSTRRVAQSIATATACRMDRQVPGHASRGSRRCEMGAQSIAMVTGLRRIGPLPRHPKGATVDALGCPSDTDGDGVLDGIDKCPARLPEPR
jgi:hypothetical protein